MPVCSCGRVMFARRSVGGATNGAELWYCDGCGNRETLDSHPSEALKITWDLPLLDEPKKKPQRRTRRRRSSYSGRRWR